MSVDLRTRADGDVAADDPRAIFSSETRTGDVTLHLSCTLHMSQPPQQRERRVMYTSFRLPSKNLRAAAKARAQLRAVREGAYTTVSQEPGHVTSQER